MSNPAEAYESCMVPALFRPWAQQLLRVAQPQLGAANGGALLNRRDGGVA